MSATHTAALVEEAERMIGAWFRCTQEERTAGVLRLLIDLVAALRRAEAELDAATTQLAKKFKRLEELEKRAEQAEAERDAQHAEVLRLTGELEALATKTGDVEWREDAAVKVVKMRGRQIAELTATRDLLLTENARLQQQLSRPDPVVHETPVDGVVPCCGQKLHDLKDGARVNEGPLVNCDRMRLLSRVGELSSENLLLTAENARLQKEVATLELLRRGGK